MPRAKYATAAHSQVQDCIAALSAAKMSLNTAMKELAANGLVRKNCPATARRKVQREMLAAIRNLTIALEANGEMLVNAERAKPSHPSLR